MSNYKKIRQLISEHKVKFIDLRFTDTRAKEQHVSIPSGMMLAGLDGIKRKTHPGKPFNQDLYELSEEETNKIPTVCASLEQALEALPRCRSKFLNRK